MHNDVARSHVNAICLSDIIVKVAQNLYFVHTAGIIHAVHAGA